MANTLWPRGRLLLLMVPLLMPASALALQVLQVSV
jgi:hypothetical protein